MYNDGKVSEKLSSVSTRYLDFNASNTIQFISVHIVLVHNNLVQLIEMELKFGNEYSLFCYKFPVYVT